MQLLKDVQLLKTYSVIKHVQLVKCVQLLKTCAVIKHVQLINETLPKWECIKPEK